MTMSHSCVACALKRRPAHDYELFLFLEFLSQDSSWWVKAWHADCVLALLGFLLWAIWNRSWVVQDRLEYGFWQTCILCISWSLDYVLCAWPFGNGKWGKATYICVRSARTSCGAVGHTFAFGALQKLILNIRVWKENNPPIRGIWKKLVGCCSRRVRIRSTAVLSFQASCLPSNHHSIILHQMSFEIGSPFHIKTMC